MPTWAIDPGHQLRNGRISNRYLFPGLRPGLHSVAAPRLQRMGFRRDINPHEKSGQTTHLEEDFHSQLTDSWIQSVSQRSECPLIQVCHAVYYAAGCIFEIHPIEDVEELRAQLNAVSLTGFDVLEESHVPAVIARPAEAALADVTERADGRLRENAHIQVIDTRRCRGAGATSIRVAVRSESAISSQPSLGHIRSRT